MQSFLVDLIAGEKLPYAIKTSNIKKLNKIILVIAVIVLIALMLIPGTANGDTPSLILFNKAPAAIPAPLSPAPAIAPIPAVEKREGDGWSSTRTKRIDVPQAEKQRIAALVLQAFPDAPIMVAVLDSESGFDCGIKNAASSARGCFQILKSTWADRSCTGNVLDVEDNISCARKIYDRYGLSPWNESKYSWGKYSKSTVVHILSTVVK